MSLIVVYAATLAAWTLHGDLNPGLQCGSPGERLPLTFHMDKTEECKPS